jgi:hypothetical protein
MYSTLRVLGLAAAFATGLAGAGLAATADVTPSGTVVQPNNSLRGGSDSSTMSSHGSTGASTQPYVTSDGRVGPAAPSAGGKVGGGSDSGGTGSGSGGGGTGNSSR